MKKIAVFLSVAALLAAFASCAKKGVGAEDTRPTIRLLTDKAGINDKSFNAAAWRGILDFYGDTWEDAKARGVKYDVIACDPEQDAVAALRQASEAGCDLVIATGFSFADALDEVAPQYPEQKYAIIDVDYVAHPNVMNFVFTEEQGSYLVGVAAALQAQIERVPQPRFGFIGGVADATLTKFEMGYIQGIRSVLPDADIVDYYAGDWSKPELAKAQAKSWYENGVYAIFSAAGSTGNGTIAQAKECRIQGKNVWAIGVDSDQYEDGLYEEKKSAVLTSMVKRVETATKYVLKSVADGTFSGKVVSLSLKDDGVAFSIANVDLRPDVVSQLLSIRQSIVDGKITIVPTYKEALAAGLAPAGLAAIDE